MRLNKDAINGGFPVPGERFKGFRHDITFFHDARQISLSKRRQRLPLHITDFAYGLSRDGGISINVIASVFRKACHMLRDIPAYACHITAIKRNTIQYLIIRINIFFSAGG